jgi:hypothetical protein
VGCLRQSRHRLIIGQDDLEWKCSGVAGGCRLQGDLVAEAGEPTYQATRHRGPILPIEVVSTLFPVVLTFAQHLVRHDQNLVGYAMIALLWPCRTVNLRYSAAK